MSMKLYNDSDRIFRTSKGVFMPKTAMEFGDREAQGLLEYKGIKDAAKILATPHSGQELKELRAENAKLKEDLAAAHAKLAGDVEEDVEAPKASTKAAKGR